MLKYLTFTADLLHMNLWQTFVLAKVEQKKYSIILTFILGYRWCLLFFYDNVKMLTTILPDVVLPGMVFKYVLTAMMLGFCHLGMPW